ncbi:HPP family protein [Paenibacillus lignilyticus]|uniref:HPP family protein n=1 Tax=Paenibacillus lignilyticus TaxID=1172615 RepID=A0ABS5CHH4_9BACL|nr:HPP family protein [Paenibacillus lignilyticus]MBP3965314.1 HPP family protein [Paenibacillus lignilyticus]
MNVKSLAICLYVVLLYWLSLHVSFLDTLFFPTIGAFSFLFLSRTYLMSELGKITFGAVVSALIGTILFYLYPSSLTLFVNAVIIIWLIRKFNWNAPPIAAVALIPFFSHSPHLWAIPISVCAALLGLMGSLVLAEVLERKFGHQLSAMFRNKPAAVESRDIAS